MSPLNWTHDVREFFGPPIDVVREANAAERSAVAAHLELLSCDSLSVRYSLRPLDKGRAALAGELQADITQTCVVTLEPIASRLGATFALELWPASDLPTSDSVSLDVAVEDEPEAIENGKIDVGRVVIEQMADRIDAYPRKPGTNFSWTDEKAAAADSDSPFAKLKHLGRRS